VSDLTDRLKSDVSDILLRASDFAVEATITFDGSSKSINVVFDENYNGFDQFQHEVGNTGPVAICATADLENEDGEIPGEVADDEPTLEIDGSTYNVTKGARYGDTAVLFLSED